MMKKVVLRPCLCSGHDSYTEFYKNNKTSSNPSLLNSPDFQFRNICLFSTLMGHIFQFSVGITTLDATLKPLLESPTSPPLLYVWLSSFEIRFLHRRQTILYNPHTCILMFHLRSKIFSVVFAL